MRLINVLVLATLIGGCTAVPDRGAPANVQVADAPGPVHSGPRMRTAATGPRVDHHQHLLSPTVAALLNEVEGGTSFAPVSVPRDVADLLARRAAAWSSAAGLGQVYTDDAIVIEDGAPKYGKHAVADFVSQRFARPYQITPVGYASGGASRRVVALYTRGEGAARSNVGLTLITLERSRHGGWRIASETMRFPAPAPMKDVDADALITLLDQADVERAVIMSIAYLLESPLLPKHPNAAARLRAENDWTAAQIARHPTRLVGFCGINPLTEQALGEMQRCKEQLGLSGLKLHFANSTVDLEKAGHLARIKEVFATANRLRMPIAAHLWSGSKQYGRKDAEIFLAEVLPRAPDVVVQVMHMAGAGPGWTDEALEVFATAVEAKDSRTKNLYFDVATVADLQSPAQLELLARRIRQIGPERILYGSDGAFGGRNTPDQEWGTFRGMVPLTDAEFADISDNVAPYLR